MKKIFKRIFYRSPEMFIISGFTAMLLSAGTSDYNIAQGNGSPVWTGWVAFIGLAVFGIGAFLAKVRAEVKEKERIRRYE